MAERPAPPPAAGPERRQPRYVDRGDGWTLAMELLTATFVWGGVGWLVDGWFGTGPVLMSVGFVVGNGLGIYLIWVRSQDRFVEEQAALLARRDQRDRRGGQGPVTPGEPGPGPGPGRPSDGRSDGRRQQ